ncbi:MAG: TRAP transporter substrate-binding protein [Roseovarius sp.]|nr:TRAP transporter substrate-binding protein [Roseovarius sp.]
MLETITRKARWLLTAGCIAAGAMALGGAGDAGATELRFVHAYPTASQHQRNVLWFTEQVTERTGGEVTFRIFPSAQIMPINQELPAIRSGQVSMTYSVAPVVASVEPLWGIFDLPFLFDIKLDDMSHAKAFFASEKGGGILAAAMERHGFKLITIAPTDYASSFYLTRPEPIRTMDDLKGLKLRIAGGRIGQLAGEVYGYSSIAIAGAELVPALSQGVVDGAILPPIYAHDNKLPVKALTITPFSWAAVTPIIMSLDEFNALTPEQQKIMMDTGSELASRSLDTVEANATANLRTLEEGGATVVTLSDEDLPAWREKARVIWDAFVEENGDEARQMVEEAMALRAN